MWRSSGQSTFSEKIIRSAHITFSEKIIRSTHINFSEKIIRSAHINFSEKIIRSAHINFSEKIIRSAHITFSVKIRCEDQEDVKIPWSSGANITRFWSMRPTTWVLGACIFSEWWGWSSKICRAKQLTSTTAAQLRKTRVPTARQAVFFYLYTHTLGGFTQKMGGKNTHFSRAATCCYNAKCRMNSMHVAFVIFIARYNSGKDT